MSTSKRPKPKRILSIDYGMARLGMAVSDEQKIFASSIDTIKAAKKIELTIEMVIKAIEKHQQDYDYDVEELIIGLPLMMSGKMGLLADEAKHFAELLQQKVSFPVKLWDERLTTAQAERSLRESSLTRKRRAKVIDAVAAVIILQSYLENLSIKRESL